MITIRHCWFGGLKTKIKYANNNIMVRNSDGKLPCLWLLTSNSVLRTLCKICSICKMFALKNQRQTSIQVNKVHDKSIVFSFHHKKNNELNTKNTTQGTNMPLNRTARTHFLMFRSIEPNAYRTKRLGQAKTNLRRWVGEAILFCNEKNGPAFEIYMRRKKQNWNIENFQNHGHSKGGVF